jgi:hypothetical protein
VSGRVSRSQFAADPATDRVALTSRNSAKQP